MKWTVLFNQNMLTLGIPFFLFFNFSEKLKMEKTANMHSIDNTAWDHLLNPFLAGYVKPTCISCMPLRRLKKMNECCHSKTLMHIGWQVIHVQ